jgi:hypothetical protein
LKIPAVDQWKNPYARFGYVVVNVLVGHDFDERDSELFFGPVHPSDVFVSVPAHWRMAQLFKYLGLFASVKEAERKGGWGTLSIPRGFTDVMNIGRARHRVTILRIEEDQP